MYYINATAVVHFEENDVNKPNQIRMTINTEIPDNILSENYLEYLINSIKTILDSGNYKTEFGRKITSSNVDTIDVNVVTGSVTNFISNLVPLTAVFHRE